MGNAVQQRSEGFSRLLGEWSHQRGGDLDVVDGKDSDLVVIRFDAEAKL